MASHAEQRAHKQLHQQRFLAAYIACGSVGQASRWAKLSRNAHYDWLENDHEYPSKWKRAQAKAAQTFEDEAARRAIRGVQKPVYYKGCVKGYITEYSDSLLQTLLKATNPEKFRDRQEVGFTPEMNELRVTIRSVLDPKPDEKG